jgi:hypothetical protein
MRLAFYSTLIVLFAALTARADLTIKADVTTSANGQSRTMHLTTSIKGTKICTQVQADPPPGIPAAFAAQMSGIQAIVIVDRSTGQRTMLMPTRKMKIDMPPVTTQPSADPANPPAPFVATGKTDTIDGNAVDEYASSDAQRNVSVWTAKDYPNADQIRPVMHDWLATAQQRRFPALDQVPGIPLKIEITGTTNAPAAGMPQAGPIQFDMTMTVSAISQDPVSDALFVIPDDYQELQGGPGGFGGGGPPANGGGAPPAGGPGGGGQ